MPKHRFFTIAVLALLISIVGAACDVLQDEPQQTLIYVTETPDFIIVTNTVTPSPSPVLAPTVDVGGNEGETTVVADAPTQAPPTATATTLITLTPTFTVTPTDTPVTEGAPLYLPVGVAPGTLNAAGVAGNCPTIPEGGFLTIYSNDPNLATQLSCPVGGASSIPSAHQPFERGQMIWVAAQGTSPQPAIFSLINDGTYRTSADTWQDGIDPTDTGAQPPSPVLQEPIRGFGKVWREVGGVRDSIGWATSPEQGGTAVIQPFERGTMVFLPQTGQTYIFFTGTPGTWVSVGIPF